MSANQYSDKHYIKIWGMLVGLLVISVLGPMIGIQAITLLTAFGIAGVKAYLVIKHFMHLGEEIAYVRYFLISAVVFMFLLFAGTAPDVMMHNSDLHQVGSGDTATTSYHWENIAAKAEIERATKAAAETETHGGH